MNKVVKKTKTGFESLKNISFFRLSIKDQTSLIKRLSFLVKAGIPVLESLQMIREQTRAKSHIKMLDMVIEDISNGQNLSTSLGKFKKVFGDFAINIIGFGETTGILSENLEYLAEELKKRQALRKKIISAFIYPAIVTVATLAITGFLMIYLFPKIIPVFTSIHMELPLSTRIIMAISNYIVHYGLLSMAVLVVIIIAITITLRKSYIFHFYFDRYLLKSPVLGKIMRDYNLANLTRTMGLLLQSGITISEAVPIAMKTTQNLVYKSELKNLSAVINRGEKISNHLKKHRGLFPDILTQVISVGERSGNLSNSFIYLSQMYEAEVDDFTKNISGLIEPILMIFMGLMVGFIAISIITPIYGITQHLNPR